MVVRTSVKVMKFLVQIFAPFLCRNQRHNIYGADCNLQSNAPAVLRRPTSKSSYLKYGFHACSICTDPGSHTTYHVWPYTDTNTLRTQTDTYKAIMAAVRQEEPVSVAKNF